MAIFPLAPLIGVLVGLLSLVLLGFGLFWVIGWLVGIGIAVGFLIAGLVILALSILGRHFVLFLLARPGHDEPRDARSQETQVIERPDGTKLNVEFYGPPAAQPIIFTHGWTANSTDWYYAKRHLSEKFRLILWDLPGSAKSSLSANGNYALDKMAADLEAVLGLAQRPAIIVGHSMGGMITLTFCKLFPQYLGNKVAGVVLVDTTYTNPVKTAPASGLLKAIQKPILEPLMHLMIILSPLVWLQNWISYFNGTAHIQQRFTSFAGQQTRGHVERMTLLQSLVPPAVIGKQMLAMFRYDATSTLERINVPTLILVGDNDRGCVPAASHYMHQQIPNSELVEFPKCGHVSIMEQHEQFTAALADFANKIAYSTSNKIA